MSESRLKRKIVTETPSPARPEPVKTEPIKSPGLTIPDKVIVKKAGGRRWWMVVLGAAMVVMSFVGVFTLDLIKNQMLAIFVVGVLVAGGVVIYFGIKKQEEKLTYVTSSGKPKSINDRTHTANSLNIYPNYIEFEYEENPVGAPWKCMDDNIFYFVHLKEANGKMTEFTLPDDDDEQRYYDPKEYANVVTMPLNKKYFSWTSSTLKMLAVGIMAVIIIAELVGLIAIGG